MNKSQSLGKWNRVYPRIPHTTPRRDSVHRKRRKEMNSQNKEWQLYGLCTVVVVVVLGVSSHTLHYRLVKQATKSLAKINSELTTSATKLPAVSVFPFLLPNNKEFNKKKKKYKENLAWLSSLFAWRENPKDTTAYGRDEGVSDVNRVGTGNEITINHGEEIERELGYIEEKERVKCRLSRNRQWYDTPRLYLYTFETSKTNHAEEKKTLEFIYLRLLVALPMLPQKRSGVHLALKSGRQRLLNGGSHTSR